MPGAHPGSAARPCSNNAQDPTICSPSAALSGGKGGRLVPARKGLVMSAALQT